MPAWALPARGVSCASHTLAGGFSRAGFPRGSCVTAKGNQMTRSQLLLASALACLPVSAHAADLAADGTIVVSALREPVDQDQVASSVTVLDTGAIERAQPIALTDLIDRTPGVSLTRNGGYGAATGLRIRGANPGQSIVVIDGMRMADTTATDGGFDFARLLTDDVARVEILRGAQSVLWGSDAIGGVVNITTTRPTRPLQGDVAIEGGSHDTVNTRAGLGGTSALVDWRVAGSVFHTDGIPTLSAGTQANGFDRQSASATTQWHLADTVSLDLRGWYDNARNSYSSAYSIPGQIYGGDYALTKQWSAYAGLNVSQLEGQLKHRLALLQSQTDNEDFDPPSSQPLTFAGHGRTRRYEYQASYTPSAQIDLLLGAEREEQRMAVGTAAATPAYAASTNSAFGQLRARPVAGLTLNAGLRYDHHSDFGGNTVLSAGGVYTPDGGTSLLRASYDEGFKAPSLYQLYSAYGVSNLQPERSKGWEVGAERHLFAKALTLSATWYERHSSNLIAFAYCPFSGIQPAVCYVPGTSTTRFGYYANIGKAEGRGLELGATLREGALFGSANYSIVVNEDHTPGAATYGQQLVRVPRHLANAELGYDLPHGITPSVAVRWAGASRDNSYSALMLAGYALVDARVQAKLSPAVTLSARVENLGNRHYQTANGYNSLGRVAYLALRGAF